MRFLVHRASSSRALLYVSMYSIFYASQSSKLIASKAISAKRKRHSVSSFSDQVTSEKKDKKKKSNSIKSCVYVCSKSVRCFKLLSRDRIEKKSRSLNTSIRFDLLTQQHYFSQLFANSSSKNNTTRTLNTLKKCCTFYFSVRESRLLSEKIF